MDVTGVAVEVRQGGRVWREGTGRAEGRQSIANTMHFLLTHPHAHASTRAHFCRMASALSGASFLSPLVSPDTSMARTEVAACSTSISAFCWDHKEKERGGEKWVGWRATRICKSGQEGNEWVAGELAHTAAMRRHSSASQHNTSQQQCITAAHHNTAPRTAPPQQKHSKAAAAAAAAGRLYLVGTLPSPIQPALGGPKVVQHLGRAVIQAGAQPLQHVCTSRRRGVRGRVGLVGCEG